MTERTKIEVGKDRRTMPVRLSDSEQAARGQQAFSENAARRKMEAEKDALDGEAKAKREEAKALGERIAQKQALIDALSDAARTGVEQRTVEIIFSYDPNCGEVIGVREDSGEEVERRKPTAEDWDVIRRVQQLPLPTVPQAEPAKVLTLVPLTAEQATTAAARTIAEDFPAGPTPAVQSLLDRAQGSPLPYPVNRWAQPGQASAPVQTEVGPVPFTEEEIADLCVKARDLGISDRKASVTREGVLNILKPILGAKPASAAAGRLTSAQSERIEGAYEEERNGTTIADEPSEPQEAAEGNPTGIDVEAARKRVDGDGCPQETMTAVAQSLGIGRDKLARLLGRRK